MIDVSGDWLALKMSTSEFIQTMHMYVLPNFVQVMITACEWLNCEHLRNCWDIEIKMP